MNPLEQLRQRTSTLHEKVENAVAITVPGLTRAAYIDKLQKFRSLYSAILQTLSVERQLSAEAADVMSLIKTQHSRLQTDIAWLLSEDQNDRVEVEQGSFSKLDLNIHEDLIGFRYVIEGSALGGQVIARFLKANLGLDETGGASFFIGNGIDTGPRWRKFTENLKAHDLSEPRMERALRAAEGTFELFYQAFKPSPGVQ